MHSHLNLFHTGPMIKQPVIILDGSMVKRLDLGLPKGRPQISRIRLDGEQQTREGIFHLPVIHGEKIQNIYKLHGLIVAEILLVLFYPSCLGFAVHLGKYETCGPIPFMETVPYRSKHIISERSNTHCQGNACTRSLAMVFNII